MVGAVFSILEGKEAGSLGDFGSARAIADVTLGFANATQITFGANRTECQFAIESLLYSADKANEVLVRDWFNWFDLWLSIDYYLWVPYNLYTVQFSCTASLSEIEELGGKYWQFTSSSQTVWFNLFYNAGSIVKGFTNIAMYFMAKEYTRVNSPFALGMELGQIFWLIFFPATDYLDDALAKGASWGQDYTWDQVIAL